MASDKDKIAENLLYKLRDFVRESAKKRLETAACVSELCSYVGLFVYLYYSPMCIECYNYR